MLEYSDELKNILKESYKLITSYQTHASLYSRKRFTDVWDNLDKYIKQYNKLSPLQELIPYTTNELYVDPTMKHATIWLLFASYVNYYRIFKLYRNQVLQDEQEQQIRLTKQQLYDELIFILEDKQWERLLFAKILLHMENNAFWAMFEILHNIKTSAHFGVYGKYYDIINAYFHAYTRLSQIYGASFLKEYWIPSFSTPLKDPNAVLSKPIALANAFISIYYFKTKRGQEIESHFDKTTSGAYHDYQYEAQTHYFKDQTPQETAKKIRDFFEKMFNYSVKILMNSQQ